MLSLHERKLVNWKEPRRVGRGLSSGQGKTCGRGTKGQKARNKVRPGFEGGQMPFVQKLPKHKGFYNRFQKSVAAVNVSDLEKFFPAGSKINPTVLIERKMAKSSDWIKILGDGELKKSFIIEAHGFSQQAEKKIKEVDGQAIVIPFAPEKKEAPVISSVKTAAKPKKNNLPGENTRKKVAESKKLKPQPKKVSLNLK